MGSSTNSLRFSKDKLVIYFSVFIITKIWSNNVLINKCQFSTKHKRIINYTVSICVTSIVILTAENKVRALLLLSIDKIKLFIVNKTILCLNKIKKSPITSAAPNKFSSMFLNLGTVSLVVGSAATIFFLSQSTNVKTLDRDTTNLSKLEPSSNLNIEPNAGEFRIQVVNLLIQLLVRIAILSFSSGSGEFIDPIYGLPLCDPSNKLQDDCLMDLDLDIDWSK